MQNAAWTQKTVEDVKQRYGLVGTLLKIWTGRHTAGGRQVRQMELLETLSLGPKRQLMLVRCGDEQFLVGGGLDRIETIVKMAKDTCMSPSDYLQDGPCR